MSKPRCCKECKPANVIDAMRWARGVMSVDEFENGPFLCDKHLDEMVERKKVLAEFFLNGNVEVLHKGRAE